MTKLLLTCSRCGMKTTLRDNGHEDPAQIRRCPFCEIGQMHVEETETPRPSHPSRQYQSSPAISPHSDLGMGVASA